jgi:hypothetical protein
LLLQSGRRKRRAAPEQPVRHRQRDIVIDNSHTEPLNSLKPQDLKSRLLATSIILSSYEIIKSMVLPRTNFSFLVGFGYGGDKYSDDYEKDVLKRHDSALIASAKYLADYKNERYEKSYRA